MNMFLLCVLLVHLGLLHHTQASFEPIDLEGCAISKGCFRPRVCPNGECAFLVTWRVVEVESNKYVEIELAAQLEESRGYVTVAFSDDRFALDDGLMGCSVQTASDRVLIRAATVNEKGRSSFYTDPDKDFMITHGDNLGGLFTRHARTLQCRFRRRITPRNSVRQFKDLSPPAEYYIIVSVGNEVTTSGFGKPNLGMPVVSFEKAVVNSPAYGSMSGEKFTSSSVMKIHGCLMVIAWVFCASIGVLMSRYYKEMWPNSVMLHHPVWQQNHRILQGFCVGFTCVAIVLAFIYCQGYSTASAWPYYVHPILGLIVFSLALVNPFLSFCRCKDRSANRPWFNWIHFFIGTIAHCLSIPTMMLGLRMPAAGIHLPFLDYPLWILIFFVIFQFFVEITLELHGCIYYRRNRDKYAMYEREVAIYLDTSKNGYGPTPQPRRPEPSGRMFKYFMLGLHSTVCAIVAVILVIIIIVN